MHMRVFVLLFIVLKPCFGALISLSPPTAPFLKRNSKAEVLNSFSSSWSDLKKKKKCLETNIRSQLV